MRTFRITELRRFARNKMMVAALIAAMCIPLLYGALYLWAFWNPTGNLDRLPVAIVQQDKGTRTSDGTTIHAGEDLTDTLVSGHALDWQVTDATDARQGLEAGRYYAVLTIPEGFSTAVSSVSGDHPVTAPLTVAYDDANGYTARTILTSVMGQVRTATSNTLGSSMVDKVLVGYGDIHSGLVKATDGAKQLTSGATSADKGAGSLADGSAKLAAGADQLSGGLGSAVSGSAQLASGATSAADGAAKLKDGSAQVASGTTTLAQGLPQAASGAQQLASGASSLSTGAGKLATGATSLHDGLTSAQTGAGSLATGAGRVASGAASASKGATTLADKAGELSNGAASLAKGLGAAPQAAGQLADGAGSVSSGSQSVADGAGKTADGATALAASLSQAAQLDPRLAPLAENATALADGATKVSQGADRVADGAGQVEAGALQLSTSLHPAAAGATKISTGAAALAKGADSLAGGVAQVSTGAGQLATGATSLQGGLDRAVTGSASLAQGAGSVADGAAKLSTGASTLSTKLGQAQAGASQLQGGAAQVAAGNAQLADKLPQLASGAQSLHSGLTSASSGASTLASSAHQLASGAQSLHAGTTKLASGSSTLAGQLGKATEQVPTWSADEAKKTADVMAAPVSLDSEFVHQASGNGEGFAPYFIGLSLYVGALILWMLLRPLSQRSLAAPVSATRVVLSNLLPGLLIGLGQVALLTTVLIAGLGLSPTHLVAFLAFALLVSAAFITLQQAIYVWFGSSVGRLVVLILLMLQLTSAGGTFPAQTTPDFFQALHGALPMTQVVNGFRAAITGGLGSEFHTAVGYLALLLVGSVAAAAIGAARGRVLTMNRLHPAVSL